MWDPEVGWRAEGAAGRLLGEGRAYLLISFSPFLFPSEPFRWWTVIPALEATRYGVRLRD